MTTLSALALGAVLAGCATEDDAQPDQAPDGVEALEPGLYEHPDGGTRAFGVLSREEIEGGFWALKEATSPADAEDASNVVVLLGLEELDVDPRDLEDGYVEARGTMVEGESFRMAGPEMEVDSLAEAPVPADPAE